MMYFIHFVSELTQPMEWKLSNKLKIIVLVTSSGGKEDKIYAHIFYILRKVVGIFIVYTEQQVTYGSKGLIYPLRHLWASMFRTPQSSQQDQSITTSLDIYERTNTCCCSFLQAPKWKLWISKWKCGPLHNFWAIGNPGSLKLILQKHWEWWDITIIVQRSILTEYGVWSWERCRKIPKALGV